MTLADATEALDLEAPPLRSPLRQVIAAQLESPLLKNGYALVANTIATGVLGLAYWVIAARVFSPSALGRGSAVVSGIMLISSIAQCNLATGLIRFLPIAGPGAGRLVARTYALAIGVSVVGTAAVIALTGAFGGEHAVLRLGGIAAVAAVGGVVAWSVFALQDAALAGCRQAVWVPMENMAFGVVKLVALVGLAVAAAGLRSQSWPVVASFIAPVLVFIVVVNLGLFRRFLPALPTRDEPVGLGEVTVFSLRDGVGTLFSQLLFFGLPVVVATRLGSTANAAFYVAFLLAGPVDLIAGNMVTAMTVEGSHETEQLAAHARAVAGRIVVIVGASMVFMGLTAPLLLKVYGHGYTSAATCLRLLCLAVIGRAATTIQIGIWRVQRRLRPAALCQVVTAINALVLAWVVAPHYGIAGVAGAVAAAQLGTAAVTLPGTLRFMRSGRAHSLEKAE
jgi:O-antigen/teichoic acid export membrane protein